MSEIAERVKEIVVGNLNLTDEAIPPDTTLSKLGADSFDAIGLIMEVERELGHCLPRDAFEASIVTAGDWTFGAFVGAIEKSVRDRQEWPQ